MNTTVKYLAAWRTKYLISMGDLGMHSGVAPSTQVRLEHGRKARLLTVVKLAKAISDLSGETVTPTQLLSVDPDAEK